MPFEMPTVGSLLIVVFFTYAITELLKYVWIKTDEQKKLIPALCIIIGALIGAIIYMAVPTAMGDASNIIEAITIGAASGLASIGANQFARKTSQYQKLTHDSNNSDKS